MTPGSAPAPASEPGAAAPETRAPSRPAWLEEASAWASSILLHAAILVALGLVTWVVQRPEPTQVAFDLAPTDTPFADAAEGNPDAHRSGAPGEADRPAPDARTTPRPEPRPTEALAVPTPPAPDPGAAARADAAMAVMDRLTAFGQAAGGDAGESAGILEGTSLDFQRVIGGARRQGLDVVLVIDATDSMTPYIAQAKGRLRDVIRVIDGLMDTAGVPTRLGAVRFGVVAYKDFGDEYGTDAVHTLPLTDDADAVLRFVDQIAPGGGGDTPEPIHRALDAATDRSAMGWRTGRLAIIVLVGDAPVHRSGRDDARALARRFATRQRGTINAIDVGGTPGGGGRRTVLDDFRLIAEAGGGSAFLLTDASAFWRNLIVSVFGQRYAQDVQTIVERFTEDAP